MKKLLLCGGLLFLCFVCKAQNQEEDKVPDSVIASYYTKLNDGREGKGNGKFSTNIICIQSLLATPHHVKDFENMLSEWGTLSEKNGMPVRVELGWNDKTKKHDKPTFKVCYTNVLKDRTDFIWIEYGLDNIITAIDFKITEDKVHIDKTQNYVQQLRAAGYRFDIGTTRIMNRFGDYTTYCSNKAQTIRVGINPINDHVTTINAFKVQKQVTD